MTDNSTPNQITEELEKQFQQDPRDLKVLSELAQALANRGDYIAACRHYETIVELEETNGKAWIALGHCYLLKAEFQKCFTAYQRALYTMEDNRDPQLWYGIGLLYHKFESYDYAEPAYQAVLQIAPDFEQKHEVLYKLGVIYKCTKNYENSIAYFKDSLVCGTVNDAKKVDVLCHIGVCKERLTDHEHAIETFTEALALEPDNAKTLEYLAWALHLAGKQEEATERLYAALALASENCAEAGDLHYLIGRCFFARDNLVEAQAAMQRAIYKNPNSYIYWCSIGILYALATQAQDSFDCFVKASNILPESGAVWFNMGVLYEHCRQMQEAALAYQRAYSLDSENRQALERKTQLQSEVAPGGIPEFVHPCFEIADVPFSIVANGPKVKPLASLPDIYKLNGELQRPLRAKAEDSDSSLVESPRSDLPQEQERDRKDPPLAALTIPLEDSPLEQKQTRPEKSMPMPNYAALPQIPTLPSFPGMLAHAPPQAAIAQNTNLFAAAAPQPAATPQSAQFLSFMSNMGYMGASNPSSIMGMMQNPNKTPAGLPMINPYQMAMISQLMGPWIMQMNSMNNQLMKAIQAKHALPKQEPDKDAANTLANMGEDNEELARKRRGDPNYDSNKKPKKKK